MVIRSLGILAIVLSSLSGMARADDPNPLADAKVGDWARYKVANDQLADMISFTQRVTKKDKDFVTIEVISKFGDSDSKPAEHKISLAEPFEPIKLFEQITGNKTEVALDKKGADEITVKGKKYETKLQEYKVTTTVGDNKVVSPLKIWTSKSVPVMGIVKIETDFADVKVRLEIDDFGREKK